MENKRILMTKRLLKEALLESLKTKEMNQITIKEICDASQINRSTFYRHYNNTMDVLEEYLKEFHQITLSCYKNISSGKEIQNSMFPVIEYIYNHKEQCFFFQKKDILNIFMKMIGPTFYLNMNEVFKNYKHSKIEQTYLPLILISASEVVISEWINSGLKETPDEITFLMLSISKRVLGL